MTLQRDASEIIKRKNSVMLDTNVRRWYENLSASSVHTAEVAFRCLDRFCDMDSTNPASLTSIPQNVLEAPMQDARAK